MSLAPEALAFIGKPPARPMEARIVHGECGKKCEQPNQHEGSDMPRGIYVRKPRIEKPANEAAPTTPAKKGRKRRSAKRAKAFTKREHPAKLNGPARFAVYNDGSVAIETTTCTGMLTAEQGWALIDFITRLAK